MPRITVGTSDPIQATIAKATPLGALGTEATAQVGQVVIKGSAAALYRLVQERRNAVVGLVSDGGSSRIQGSVEVCEPAGDGVPGGRGAEVVALGDVAAHRGEFVPYLGGFHTLGDHT
jgi:hypothetical protein